MKNLKLFAVTMMLAGMTGCLSFGSGSGKTGPQGPQGEPGDQGNNYYHTRETELNLV